MQGKAEEFDSAKEKVLKARMSVVLRANEVVVAEVEDAALWNAVFAAINSGSSSLLQAAPVSPVLAGPAAGGSVVETMARNTPVAEPINKFAKELSVDLDVLIGACDPTPNDPYLRLDPHHWEKMRKELPARGVKALPPIVVAATILCLWSRHAALGSVTQAQAQSVLAAINSRDNNPTRGIAGASWLQARPGGQIVLNPSQISRAITIAKGFCEQDWSAWKAL
ncbi:hypothetical protein [Luteimonas granuli]|uniref:Uncharacterized protein n=1 Tax=Luteimonas granuli TaxID=1176533 RepID=A0A518N6Y6_9GAMM|nr:hypothetical protein [Luteimonas granuli]QDW67677.1 hypothetical protein FPZ22_12980 [Luteimonas granuli]